MAKTGKELCGLSYVAVTSTVFQVTREEEREPDFVDVPVDRSSTYFGDDDKLVFTNLGTKTEMKVPESLILCHSPIWTFV